MSDSSQKPRGTKSHVDILLIGGLLLGWFALQAFVLPGLGVST
ncbi:MAG: hypothetical protein ACODAD_00835 [Planctomycetota bacterium]